MDHVTADARHDCTARDAAHHDAASHQPWCADLGQHHPGEAPCQQPITAAGRDIAFITQPAGHDAPVVVLDVRPGAVLTLNEFADLCARGLAQVDLVRRPRPSVIPSQQAGRA